MPAGAFAGRGRLPAVIVLSTNDLCELDTIEAATTAVLTLAEGLDREELARARLTREEVRRHLLRVSRAVSSLSRHARAALPELDCDAWCKAGQHLEAGQPADSDYGWLAIGALAPMTLGWLRFYRKQQPELFAPSSE